jgi:putative oxidoreductase
MQAIASRRPRLRTSLVRLRVTFLLRLSLAAVFFWFGMLKLTGVSPVAELLHNSIPFLGTSPYIELLGLAEIVIAIGLIIERLANQAAILMILHLFGTLSIAIIAPTLVFAPAFPVLTMGGEFLAKNLVLITAGLAVISSHDR